MNGEVKTVLEIIETLGVVGILGLLVWAFYSGKLISSKVNDKIIGVYQKEAEKLTNGLGDKMDKVCSGNDEICKSQKQVIGAVQQLGPKLDNIHAAITRGQAQGGD